MGGGRGFGGDDGADGDVARKRARLVEIEALVGDDFAVAGLGHDGDAGPERERALLALNGEAACAVAVDALVGAVAKGLEAKERGALKAAFGAADFSGMHTGGEELSISAVIHKAFVDVNEEGTEAAAATGVVVGTTSAAPPPKPKYFRADRPFLYLIRDHKTGSVLFMGRLVEPAK